MYLLQAMMVNETMLAKPEQTEKGNMKKYFRNERFEAYYDPDITPPKGRLPKKQTPYIWAFGPNSSDPHPPSDFGPP